MSFWHVCRDIDGVSGFEPETVEQTFERLRRNERRVEADESAPPSATAGAADTGRYPAPEVDPALAYEAYKAGWKPDALVLMHPELFAGGGAQTQVEVAVFALAACGLVPRSVADLTSEHRGAEGAGDGQFRGSGWAAFEAEGMQPTVGEADHHGVTGSDRAGR